MQRTTIQETEATRANGIHANGEDAMQLYIPEALYWEKYYEYPDINYKWNNGQLEVVPNGGLCQVHHVSLVLGCPVRISPRPADCPDYRLRGRLPPGVADQDYDA
jgi:hypothetical protein